MTLDAETDRDFDLFFSKEARKLSRTHWTPVAVAAQAAFFLTEGKAGARILDVGAGVGKFCFVGAARTSGHFCGVERHPALVDEAKGLARAHNAARVKFLAGDVLATDWRAFDGLYLYNPFAEDIALGKGRVRSCGAERAVFLANLAATKAKLEAMPVGARAAVYFGYGGDFPDGYVVEQEERIGTGTLALWTKTH